MRLFGVLLLVSLAVAATTGDDDRVVVTEEFFPDQFSIYTADHDIVNVFVPLDLKFSEDIEDKIKLFFIEADIHNNGNKFYRGLYVLRDQGAKKLLPNGRDATAAKDSREVYFAATDGIYSYNVNDNTAFKYGSLTDDIINIAKEHKNNSDVLYILTKSKKLYKVTKGGTQKTKVNEVIDAQQFVLDFANNIYFYADDKAPHVLVNGEVKKIAGLPENPTEVTLLKPPFVIVDGVPAVIDDKSYTLYSNGTSELMDFTFQVKPTAYSMEGTVIQYYARNKKIYEYDILAMAMDTLLEARRVHLANKNN